jgi:hypothetical protein
MLVPRVPAGACGVASARLKWFIRPLLDQPK